MPRWCPPARALDTLELLRAGAVPDSLVVGPQATTPIRVPDDVAGDAVEIVDTEGVPLARARIAAVDGGRSLSAIETWLGHRSPRPFERLHRPPGAFSGPGPVLLVEPGTSDEQLRAAVERTPGVRVLVLASLAADGAGVAAAALRRFERLLAGSDADLVVVPADRGDPAMVEGVAAAYAHGGTVTTAWAAGSEPTPARGVVVLLTGLSGSGKSTIARAVRDHVIETSDRSVSLLDGDEVRRHLSAGLTFSVADRETNIRRIGWVAAEIAHHGGLVLCSPIAPFATTRADVRRFVQDRGGRFVLVHVATPLAECERRDRKGLYARARAGLIPDFTGISSPYEEPDDADLVLDTTEMPVEEARDRVLRLLA